MRFGMQLDVIASTLSNIDRFCASKNMKDMKGYDLKNVTAETLVNEFGTPDVFIVMLVCETYDPQHRRKGSDGYTHPNTESGAKEDSSIMHIQFMIRDLFLHNRNLLWFMICPVCELRDAAFMQSASRYTVDDTDIWTNHPNPEFKSGEPLYDQIISICKERPI